MNYKKSCTNDNDCDSNYLCSFNTENLNHYCTPIEKNNLYEGCLSSMNNKTYIETKTNNDAFSFKSCVDFSRRQLNEDGLNHNYVVYKPKENTYVDTTTINIYLKCNEEVLAVIPHSDYFTLKCNGSFEVCDLKAKSSLFNFIKQNTKNCQGNIYLDVEYLCENENIRTSKKIPVDLKNANNNLSIKLSCPVDPNNELYQTKCYSLYNDGRNDSVQKDIPSGECKYPLYRTPFMVKDKTLYEKIQTEKRNKELKSVESNIEKKNNEILALQAEKYQKTFKLVNGRDISYDQALFEVKKNSKGGKKNFKNEWIVFENYDAATYLLQDNKLSDLISIYNKNVKTIEDAKRIANENNKKFFVWYHNNYNNSEYSSKLFFIETDAMINPKINIKDKKMWKKDQNVSTCILTSLSENYNESGCTIDDIDCSSVIDEIKDVLTETNIKETQIDTAYNSLVNNISTKYDVNIGVIKKLDNNIVTLQQKIGMNNYEETINDQILRVLHTILFFVFIFSVIVLVYMNMKYGDKVKLFGSKQSS